MHNFLHKTLGCRCWLFEVMLHGQIGCTALMENYSENKYRITIVSSLFLPKVTTLDTTMPVAAHPYITLMNELFQFLEKMELQRLPTTIPLLPQKLNWMEIMNCLQDEAVAVTRAEQRYPHNQTSLQTIMGQVDEGAEQFPLMRTIPSQGNFFSNMQNSMYVCKHNHCLDVDD